MSEVFRHKETRERVLIFRYETPNDIHKMMNFVTGFMFHHGRVDDEIRVETALGDIYLKPGSVIVYLPSNKQAGQNHSRYEVMSTEEFENLYSQVTHERQEVST